MKKRIFLLLSIFISVTLISIGVYYAYTNNFFIEKDPSEYEELYVEMTGNEIDVYIRDEKDDYIGYHINHLERGLNKFRNASNYDVWNLAGASNYTRNKYGVFEEKLELVTSGEWELAIREEGANDFFGGAAHGDEITTSIHAVNKGQEIDVSKNQSFETDEFKIVSESDLYRDNTTTDDLELAGKHFKEYTFNKNGLTLTQEVEFFKNLSIDVAYLGMLPTLREDGDTQITDTYTINDNQKKYDVSYEDEALGDSTIGDKVTISGEDNGFTASMEILEKRSEFPSEILVWNAARYNKMYFIYASDGYQIKEGEIWGQTTEYNIQVDN